jgi:hypothetical protein
MGSMNLVGRGCCRATPLEKDNRLGSSPTEADRFMERRGVEG